MRRDGQGRRRSGVNTDAEPSHLSLRLVGADCWETNVVRTGARNGPGGCRPAPARADAPDKVVAADLITEADIPGSTVASWVNRLDSGQRLDGLALRPHYSPSQGAIHNRFASRGAERPRPPPMIGTRRSGWRSLALSAARSCRPRVVLQEAPAPDRPGGGVASEDEVTDTGFGLFRAVRRGGRVVRG